MREEAEVRPFANGDEAKGPESLHAVLVQYGTTLTDDRLMEALRQPQ